MHTKQHCANLLGRGVLGNSIKWLLFPGINLHARLRYRILPRFLPAPNNNAEATLLDAGCGNGMLTYQGYLRGYKSLGISIKQGEIERNQRLFNKYLGISEDRLAFRLCNLYELPALKMQFDQVICSEVLENIRRDREVCEIFWDILKPGGMLHLCCPNAAHPDNQRTPLDTEEKGGHVRPGYTAETYRELLEPIGFQLSEVIGLGGPIRQSLNKMLMRIENFAGLPVATAFFLVLSPLVVFDPRKPKVPYSIYIRATKPP